MFSIMFPFNEDTENETEKGRMEKASTNHCTLKLIKSLQIVTETTCMQYNQGKRVDEVL